jgi:hypothetical protein
MASSGMLRHVALVRTDVLEEFNTFIKVTRIGELGTALAVTSCNQRRHSSSAIICLWILALESASPL